MMRRNYSVGVIAIAVTVAAGFLAFPSGASADAAAVGYAGGARGVTDSAPISNTSQQFTSRNWDGYITYASSHAKDFNAVSATWKQPTVTCNATQAWTVFWVGLDGWWDNTVEQGGSEAFCATSGGTPSYSIWWEMYPTNSIQTVLAINVGDTITASVKFATATSVFTITVKDVTSGNSFTRHETCGSGLTCDRSSTDVITEDVGRGGGGFFPLAKYATTNYTKVSATDLAAHKASITGTNWLNAAVTEKSGAITYATVSALTATGAGFSTIWKHK
jgi:hypothetical protein